MSGGKKVSRPRGRDGAVPEKGKSVCDPLRVEKVDLHRVEKVDPLRVRGDLSDGGVTSNLDQRVIFIFPGFPQRPLLYPFA